MRKSHNSAAAAVAALVLLAATAIAQPPNPYRTIAGLVQPPAGRVLGSMSMVDVAKDGTLWIAERCGENNCLGHDAIAPIIHTDANGKWLAAFLVPHALALDPRGRLFVADRDNNRVQIFDQDGGFLEEWKQFGRPSGLHISADDTLYVSDNQSNEERHLGWARGIRVGSAKDGSVSAFIPDPDFDPKRSQETGAHGLAADARGAIYGAEVYSQSVKKYVR
jgi:sugar lactone lactonase YvrE